MSKKNLQQCYNILGVTPDTPWEEIKRTYHDLMKVWHPDRFTGDPRLQKIGEEKTKEITYAFKKIEEDYHRIKIHGDPLEEEREEHSIKVKPKPHTETEAQGNTQKSQRHARKQEAQEWLRKVRELDIGNYRIVIYGMTISCILVGIVVLMLPMFLSRDNGYRVSEKEMTKKISVPASPFSVPEKAIPVSVPVPTSGDEKTFRTMRPPHNDRLSTRETKILKPSSGNRKKLIKENIPETKPLETKDIPIPKEQESIERESNRQIIEEKGEQVKKAAIQDPEVKTITEREKEREHEEKKLQQLEKLRSLEKEFPFTMIKER